MLCGNDYNDLQFSRISRGMQGKNTDRTIPVALVSARNHMPRSAPFQAMCSSYSFPLSDRLRDQAAAGDGRGFTMSISLFWN